MFVRTQRLLLRPAWPEDWQMVYDGIADEGIVRNLARAPWPYSESDARSFCARPHSPKFPSLLITLPSTRGSLLVGGCGLGNRDGETELGYWIARRNWGRGYATEAACALIDIARVLGHRRLVAGHFDDNPASGRVLEKAGFRNTGRAAKRYSAGRGERADCCEFEMEIMCSARTRASELMPCSPLAA